MLGDWQPRVTDPELAARYQAAGFWSGETLGGLFARSLDAHPGNEVHIWSATRPWQGTIADVHAAARRFAAGLRSRGIGPGDIVAFQLPNWIEAAIAFYGTLHAGATVAPVVHFYGPKELTFILAQSGAKVLVTADRFGHLDYLAQLDHVRQAAPAVEQVVVVGDSPPPAGTVGFDAFLGDDAHDAPPPDDVDAPVLIAYTSGTTSDPKGVVHSHRSIVAEIHQLGAIQKRGDRPLLVGAPVGHGIGLLAGLVLPPYRGQPIHLLDVWDPARVLEIVLENEVTAGSGSTFFLQSLIDHPSFTPAHLEKIRFIGLGGSAVPAAFCDRAEAMGISVTRSFGCTEHPSITGSVFEDPREQRNYTDGRLLPGCEIRLVDDGGHDVAQGEAGEIWSRGPDLFPGYTDPALTAEAFHDGWYATGDVGVLDEHGFLAITDRKKDVIIRGGENISAGEVEELLLTVPGVAEVAVVAAPDARLGEHACAFIRTFPGTELPQLDDVRRHLDQAGLTRQKWPEELRPIAEFPRTPSGKIKKFVLRQQLRDEAAT